MSGMDILAERIFRTIALLLSWAFWFALGVGACFLAMRGCA